MWVVWALESSVYWHLFFVEFEYAYLYPREVLITSLHLVMIQDTSFKYHSSVFWIFHICSFCVFTYPVFSFHAGYWSSSPMSAEVAGGHPYFLSCYFWFIYCIKFRDFTWYKWNTRSFVLILPTMWISCSWWIWQDSSSFIWVQKHPLVECLVSCFRWVLPTIVL